MTLAEPLGLSYTTAPLRARPALRRAAQPRRCASSSTAPETRDLGRVSDVAPDGIAAPAHGRPPAQRLPGDRPSRSPCTIRAARRPALRPLRPKDPATPGHRTHLPRRVLADRQPLQGRAPPAPAPGRRLGRLAGQHTRREHRHGGRRHGSRLLVPVVGAAASRCLARRSPVGPRNVGRVRLGYTRRQARRRIPTRVARRGRYVYRWCVKRSAGRVNAVFSRRSSRGRARLVVTTARGHGMRGVRRGVSVRRLRARFPHRRRLARGLYRAGPHSRRLFGVRRGKVRFAAVADRRLIRDGRALRRYLRRAGL